MRSTLSRVASSSSCAFWMRARAAFFFAFVPCALLLAAGVLPRGKSVLKGELSLPDAEVWSPESPRLYMVTATLARDGQVFDDLIDRVGLREVCVEAGAFF